MRSKKLGILFILLTTFVFAQAPNFNIITSTYEANNMYGMSAADIDNDGDIDLVFSINGNPNMGIYWSENNGNSDLSFSNYTKRDIETGVSYGYLETIDFDRDGDIDIVSVRGNDPVWLKNDGSGFFTKIDLGHRKLYYDERPFNVVDFDKDGDLDILYGVGEMNSDPGDKDVIGIFINDGSMNFSHQYLIQNLEDNFNVFCIDFDKDGDLDILQNNQGNDNSSQIAWYKNNGSFNFSGAYIEKDISDPHDQYAVDLDQDGNLDVIATGRFGMKWYKYDDNQSQVSSTLLSSEAHSVSKIFPTDIDNDGDIDILVNSKRFLELYLNDGNENFTKVSIEGGYRGGVGYAADLDLDGDIDFLRSNVDQSERNTYLQIVENQLERGQISDNWSSKKINTVAGNDARDALAVDMDKDGDMDVVSASSTDKYVFWYENDGSENFTDKNIYNDAGEVESIFAVDLDRDGDTDVLSISTSDGQSPSSNDNKLLWYENNGSQSFTVLTIYDYSSGDNYTPQVRAADMDNDGDIDVVAISQNSLHWFENDGNQNFTARSLGASGQYISLIDINNDGQLDIGYTEKATYSSSNIGTISWFRNNGDKTFTERPIINAPKQYAFPDPWSSSWGDIDKDGDVDVVFFDNSSDKFYTYKNNGSATGFSQGLISDDEFFNPNVTSIILEDLDLNGQIDILFGYTASGYGAFWFQNDGNTNFTKRTIKSGIGPITIFSSDIDTDGDLDVVAATGSGNEILWIENNYDAIVPNVVSVSSTNNDSYYKIGDVITITTNWSEASTVSGSPKLKLETGSSDRYATYSSGSGSTVLIFNYTVAINDTTEDLDYHSTIALELNGGSIQDASGNNADLTLPVPGTAGSLGANKALVIDGNAPSVLSVTSSKANGGYKAGETIPVNVNFNQIVILTGSNQIMMETGSSDQAASYASGSGTATLVFNYIVSSGDNSNDLDYISASALSAGDGLKDASGNNAVLTLPTPGASGSLSANKNLVIDTTSPTVSSVSSSKASAAYKVGESIPITVTFNDNVTVVGVPHITLETGSSDAIASYTSGTGSTNLIFNYIVGASDKSSDLSYISTSALSLNSGTIQDSLGNNAILSLPSPGAANSLSNNEAIIIDNQSPVVTLDPADGATSVLPTLPLKINFNEYVRFIDNTILTSDNVDALITLKDSNAQGADIPFDANVNDAKTVITIDPTSDFLSEQIIYYSISASLEDSLDHLAPSASATVTMKDVIKPTVTFNPSNGSIKIPGNRDIAITFNERMRKIDDSEITNANVASLVKLKGNNASGADFNFSATINDAKTVITIDPLFDFSANSVVYVGIDAVVEDDADNAIDAASAIFITDIPDVIGPQVVNVTSSNEDNTYTIGDDITVTIEFDEVAVVEGSGSLQLEILTKDPSISTYHSAAYYIKGSGTTILEFLYTIGSNENSNDLSYRSNNALEITGATQTSLTVKDRIGNNANLSLPNPGSQGSLSFNKNIVIDTKGPQVISIGSSTENGSYRNGAIIKIVVDFDEDVYVLGSPSILLETGSNKGSAIYFSGSATSTLVFDYVVQIEHNTNDLDYAGNNALKLNGGSIKDIVAIDANLLLPIVNSNTLGGRKDIRIDNIPPLITQSSINNNGNIPVLYNSKINYTVSEKVQSADLNMNSALEDIVNGTLLVTNANQSSSVELNLLAPFTSGDAIQVTIENLTDLAGNVSQDIEFEYNVSLIADFNTDGFIDAADLTTLVQGWINKDLSYELGPTTGEVPNLKPALDGKFDIMDAAVLIRMWHWNLNNNSQSIPRYTTMGNPIQYQNKDNSFSIDILENTNAMDLYIDYPTDKVQISILDQPSNNNNILLTHLDSLSGVFQMAAGFMDEVDKGLDFNYQIHGREDISINVIYRYFDHNGNIFSKGTEEILLIAVPKEFALHNNYPNPFNPTTTMRFDLPIQTDAKVMIFNMLGQKVKTFDLKGVSAGYHSVKWDARNDLGDPVGAGVYFYQLQTKNFTKTKKMVLLK